MIIALCVAALLLLIFGGVLWIPKENNLVVPVSLSGILISLALILSSLLKYDFYQGRVQNPSLLIKDVKDTEEVREKWDQFPIEIKKLSDELIHDNGTVKNSEEKKERLKQLIATYKDFNENKDSFKKYILRLPELKQQIEEIKTYNEYSKEAVKETYQRDFPIGLFLVSSFFLNLRFYKRRKQKLLKEMNLTSIYTKLESLKKLSFDNVIIREYNDRINILWKLNDGKILHFLLNFNKINLTLKYGDEILQEKNVSYENFSKDYSQLAHKISQYSEALEKEKDELMKEKERLAAEEKAKKMEDLIFLALASEQEQETHKALKLLPGGEEIIEEMKTRQKLKIREKS